MPGGAAARDSSGRLAAPGGMTFKRDDTQVVPYEDSWLAAQRGKIETEIRVPEAETKRLLKDILITTSGRN
jgi:hypothetical protein